MIGYLGWGFPLGINKTGGLRTASGLRLIEQSVSLILGTTKGERVTLPDFGCELNQLVFAPNNPDTLSRIVGTVSEALLRWEPRVTVDNVEATPNPTNPTRVDISIECTIDETGEQLDLGHLFYLGGT